MKPDKKTALEEKKPLVSPETTSSTAIQKIKEKTTAKVSVKAKVVEIPMITNVYSADFSVIDNTIEEIKKQTRKVGTSHYASNNIYLILEDALKKIILAYK